MTDTYATDGKCHNAEPGNFNHECGKPAVWIGAKPNGFRSGFCDDCKHHGFEAAAYRDWQKITPRVCASDLTQTQAYKQMVLDAFDKQSSAALRPQQEHRRAVEYAARKRL